MHKVSIIGAGVVGTAMGYLLKRGGYHIAGISSRRIESAKKAIEFIGEGDASTDPVTTAKKADIVFITTPDRAIEDVCIRVASEGGFNPSAIVFHMSGALSSEILGSARRVGARVGSIHPLQSLADLSEAVKNIPNSYFCIEGDEEAVSAAREIVDSVGGKEITIGIDKKPLYHAGASVASNFLIRREDSLHALMPLIKGTIANIERLGIPKALTGPISRGDIEVVDGHLKGIAREKEELINLYLELGRYTVKVAIEKGSIKREDAEKIVSLLNEYDKYHKRKEINHAHNR